MPILACALLAFRAAARSARPERRASASSKRRSRRPAARPARWSRICRRPRANSPRPRKRPPRRAPARRSSPACSRPAKNAPRGWPPTCAARSAASRPRRGALHRARAALSERLVAIYESGTPSTASVILASGSFDELATRTEYLRADRALRLRPGRPRGPGSPHRRRGARADRRPQGEGRRLQRPPRRRPLRNRRRARGGRSGRRATALGRRRALGLAGHAQIEDRRAG